MNDSSSASGEKRKRDADDILPSPKTQVYWREIMKQPDPALEPGNRDDSWSFIRGYQNEPLVAAYLGFSNTRDLRRFARSNFLLFFLTHFEGLWKSDLGPWKGPLDSLRLCHLNGKKFSPEKGLMMDTSKIDAYRPMSLNAPPGYDYFAELGTMYLRDKKNAFFAHILVLLVAEIDIRSPGPPTLLWKEDVAKMKENQKAQKAVYGMLDLSEPAEIVWPKLNPDLASESDMEPYNRALILLLYARHAFKTGLFREADWDAGIDTAPYRPKWMVDGGATASTGPISPTLPSMKFVLVWRRKGQSKAKQEALNTCIKADEDREPPARLRSSADPRMWSPKRYRDCVRRDFKCFERRLKISRMRWQRPNIATDDDSDPEDVDHDLLTCEWADFIADLTRFESEHVVIAVSFEPMPEGQMSEEDFYECEG